MPVATQILSPALARGWQRSIGGACPCGGAAVRASAGRVRRHAACRPVLAATLVDVVANEEAGPAGFIDGIDFAYAGNKAALGWLRGRRNALLHHEGPTDGLMGEAIAADWHRRDAERAVAALLDYLDDLVHQVSGSCGGRTVKED